MWACEREKAREGVVRGGGGMEGGFDSLACARERTKQDSPCARTRQQSCKSEKYRPKAKWNVFHSRFFPEWWLLFIEKNVGHEWKQVMYMYSVGSSRGGVRASTRTGMWKKMFVWMNWGKKSSSRYPSFLSVVSLSTFIRPLIKSITSWIPKKNSFLIRRTQHDRNSTLVILCSY